MEFLKIGPWGFVSALLWFGVILLICGRIGGAFLAAIRIPPSMSTAAELNLFSIALGIILLSLGVLWIGLMGFLTKNSVLILILALALFPSALKQKNCFGRAGFKTFIPQTSQEKVIWICLIGALVVSCLQCGAPPIGNDALAYHLDHPKHFIQNHQISYLALTRESLWPFQTEMLFTIGLLLQGTTLAQFFHWCFYLLTTAGVYLFGRRYYGAPVGGWAALIFAYTPVIFAQSSEAYVDLGLAFFVFLSLYALWMKEELGELPGVILCGIFIGGALATKYLALVPFAMILVLVAVRAKLKISSVVFFILSAFLVSGVWYLRSALILGNPAYPFLSTVFGGRGFEAGNPQGTGGGVGLVYALMLGWNLTMHPSSFGGESIGPVYLMFLPLLLFRIKRADKNSLVLFAFAACYGLSLFFSAQSYFNSQSARFFTLIMPFASVGAACALDQILAHKHTLRRFAMILFLMAILLEAGIAVYRLSKSAKVVLGLESARGYLEREERSYTGYRFLNEEVPYGSKIFNAADIRRFYNHQPHMVFSSIPLEQKLKAQGRSLPDYLSAESFDYLWLSHDARKFFWDYAGQHSYQKIFSYRFKEGPKVFVYDVLKKPN